MRLRLRAVAAALLCVCAASLSAIVPARADEAAALAAAAAKGNKVIPALGFPYASDGTIGTIDIRGFSFQGGKIVAPSVVRINGKATAARLPVRIVEATCSVLQLEVGPAPGLKRPLRITETVSGGSELRQRQFCEINAAVDRKDLKEAAILLNDKGAIGGSVAMRDGGGSCPWYVKAGCGVAIAACAASCIDPLDGICEACIEAIDDGSDVCVECIIDG